LATLKKRAYQRYPCNLPAKVATDNGEIEGIVSNISLGGMSLQTASTLTFHATVKVRFRLPTMDSDTEVDAIVRWNKDQSYGLQFGSLRAKDVWGLNRFFEKSE
jgi:hypothetical protein